MHRRRPWVSPLARVVPIGLACLVASASRAPAFVAGDGKGKPETDCLIGLDGVGAADLTPFGRRKAVQCTDCNPACDHDGIDAPNQACTFRVGVCLNQPGIEGCLPQVLKKVKVAPKKLGVDAPLPDGDAAVCGDETTIVVPTKKKGKKRGKKKLRLLAKPEGKGKDKDTFLFVCEPRPAGEACPPAAATTTSTMVSTSTTTVGSTSTTTTSLPPTSNVVGGDLVDNLLESVKDGVWDYEEGLIASLQLLADELDAQSVLGTKELLYPEGTGIVAEGDDYLASNPDGPAADEVARLLEKIVFTGDELDAMAEEPAAVPRGATTPTTAEENCASFFEGHTVPAGITKCLQKDTTTIGGVTFRIFQPHPSLPDGGWMDHHYQWALEAIADSVAAYDAFGTTPPLQTPATDILFSVAFKGGTQASAWHRLRPCVVTVWLASQVLDEIDFKQVLAHELAHCVQSETFPEANGSPYSVQRWRNEGLAEYLSNVVYPENNLEWGNAPQRRSRLEALQPVELTTSLFQRAYSNFLFFQYLANEIGHPGIVGVVQALAAAGTPQGQQSTLAGYAGMPELYLEFAKAMTDQTIEDSGGGTIPYAMTPQNRIRKEFFGADQVADELGAFEVSRYHLIVDPDRQADLMFSKEGDLLEASRREPGSEWGEVPMKLPHLCSEIILVATSATAGATYAANVPEVVDAPAQCTLEGTWVVDNDSLGIMATGYDTEYVSGEIRGTFHSDGTVEVVYDDFEFRTSDTDFLSVGGIVIEQYEAFTETTNASGVTSYAIEGDEIDFEHFFESNFLEGTEVLHHVVTNDPPDTIGPDVDETFVRDHIRGQSIFVSSPRYELDGTTLRLIDDVGVEEIITLHRAGN